jgi:N-methylhydantoinase A
VLTIGAGGGSIAWIDQAGALRNGPQSAGADPGPACYGHGNELPTNTDANLVLGRLGDNLIGGAMVLDRADAERAVAEHVAAPLGLGTEEAALAILQVANANMADAVRLISIRRGYDPREFALVVFGGAGPLHGVALARELSIPTVLVPPNPGITSALGCLLVDIRHDLSVMYLARTDRIDPGDVEAEFERLEAEARERLGAEGVAEEQMQLQRFLDMRYLGQWRSMAIPVVSPLDLAGAVAVFHQEHEREHNYRRDQALVEIFRLNVRAIGRTPKAELHRHDLNGGAPVALDRRPIIFDELAEPIETPVFLRDALTAGTAFEGPAVIEQLDSTTLVPPGVRAEVDQWLNIRIHIEELSG